MASRSALVLVLLALLGTAVPAAALEARVTEVRMAGGTLRAALEIRDMFPVRFQSILTQGGALHLRLQLELWEDRAIWDRLAQPALITVFRIILDPLTRQVSVSDRYGEISRQPAWQEPLTIRLDVGRTESVREENKYYLRTLATLGTIAEKEEATGEAVFGGDDGSVSLGSIGRVLFHAVLQVNDYLQSVSAESRSRTLTGREFKAGGPLRD
jgi:hypothetical protein